MTNCPYGCAGFLDNDSICSACLEERKKISGIALEALSKLEKSGHGTAGNGRIKKGAPVRLAVRDIAIKAGYSTGFSENVSAIALDTVSDALRFEGLTVKTESSKRFVSL